MKKWLKILGVVCAVIVLAVGVALALFFWRFPHVPPAAAVHIDRTAQQIERGRYLANQVTVCVDCHSTRNWALFSGPVQAGTEGRGGERFGEEFGFPGTFYAANITPAALGTWSDGEILRTITSGVTRTGRAMFPVMPYNSYGNLTEEDAEAIVAYIRTLKPIDGSYPASRLNFPMSLIVRTIPQPYTPQPAPDRGNLVAYGQYLTTIAGCSDCHTQRQKGQPVAGMTFAGGMDFPLPRGGVVHSANISPDMKTGIGAWTREVFVARFQAFRPEQNKPAPVADGAFNTIMPWTMYAGMTDEDLGAIYAYLRTVKPVAHEVKSF
jgi:mono/diheme cytochrome c family protein